MHLHTALARALRDHGTTHLFGLMGDGNLYMVDAFVRQFEGEYVSAAHEAGAVLMANGYASVSGGLGVATVTHGPALTNAVTALVEAVRDSTPLLLIVGDTAADDDMTLQDIDHAAVVAPTGARFVQVRSPRTALADLAVAMHEATLLRTPVVLNVPFDFMWQEIEYEPVALPPVSRVVSPGRDSLEEAAALLSAASRPIVVAGRGATTEEARAALLDLAARIGAPLATTLRAKGLFKDEEGDLGIFGGLASPMASDAIARADLVITFGASVSRRTSMQDSLLAGKRVIQVNLDPLGLGRLSRYDVGVVADSATTARALVELLDEAAVQTGRFRATLDPSLGMERVFDPCVPQERGRLSIVDAMRWVNKALPVERNVVFDAGRHTHFAFTMIEVPSPQAFVYTINFGSIGLGMANAVGASVARPDRPTLMICGDGGFMLGGLNEFNAAVRFERDIVVALFNDQSYGAEHVQFTERGMDPSLSLFQWPDFGPLAAALGGAGVTVRSVDDLDMATDAVERRSRKGPMLIDFKLEPQSIVLPS